jgi:flagellar motor switch/type III secretory pathway protein FliN
MDGSILDADELEAIRNALGQATRAPSRPANANAEPNPIASPIALIADDRAAERARPDGLKLAQRWAGYARTRLIRLCGAKLEVEGTGAEIVDSPSLREQLAWSWTECVAVSDRAGQALVAASGPMIEGLAARLLGGSDSAANDRPPSPTALRVFAPIGETLLAALAEAWREEQGCEVRRAGGSGDDWRRQLSESDVVVVITLGIGGVTSGRVRLMARPETLLSPPVPTKVVPAPRGAIQAVLGQVPAEIRVDLGRARLSMAELGTLRPGSIVVLDRAADDPLPVFCAGQALAYGRPLVSRGVLAVEIVDGKPEDR